MSSNKSDLMAFIRLIRSNFWFLAIFTSVFAVLAIVVALSLPNKYSSQVKLAAVEEESNFGLGALAGQFGGLASLAGVSLGGSDVNRIIDTLNSRDFIKSFIQEQDIAVEIFAVEEWDISTDSFIYDEDIYDAQTQQWVREPEPLKTVAPTDEELYERFREMMSVGQDKKTDLITLSVTHYKPALAQQWAQQLTRALSEYLRAQDLAEAERSIAFINENYAKAEIVEVRTTLSQVLQEQYQKLMLTKVRDYYGFEIRDSAYLPEEKSSPKRALMVVGITFLGGLLGLFIVLVRVYVAGSKDA